MWRRVMGLGLLALATLSACGGQVKGGSSDPAENMPIKTPPKAASGGSAARADNGADNPDADTDLGDCQLGPAEYGQSDDPCPWVADDRCYQTREMACNCACPRSHNS